MLGQTLSNYKIIEKIGAGGMGEVYRAIDTRLGRDVAIKILPEGFARNTERIARLRREAQMLAALNHPNIAAVYDLGEADGKHFLVLELVPGLTLAERLARGALPIREAITVCRQIAEALETAHEKGIIHRDLKPANVMITPEGRVKLLDFGLAKAHDSSPSDADQDRTLTEFTEPGMVVGTAPYMSPEQVRGLPLDKRSDIWSFGCVLYEALSGRRLIEGKTPADILAAVLREDSKLNDLPRDTPPAIRLLLERCLRHDLARRLRDMGDARIELEESASTGYSAVAAPPPPRPRGALWAMGGFVLASALFGGWWLWCRRAPVPARAVQFQRLTDFVGMEESPAISPDRKTVAFVAVTGGRRQIWLRLLTGGVPLAITKDDADHYGPRWSPDSSSLIYYTPGKQTGEAGTLWEISALGGSGRRLVSALGPGDLSHDGKLLAFFRFHEGATELAVIARDQSYTGQVAKLQDGVYFCPRWSPDDKRIALLSPPGGPNFSTNLLVVGASGGPLRTLSNEFDFQGFTWTPDGSGLIVSSARDSTMAYPPTFNLWFVPLGSGAPLQLTFGESSYEFPDMSGSGELVVSRVRGNSDVWKFPVTGTPAENARQGVRITHQTGQLQTLTVSPDESEVAFLSDNGGHANVWVARVADGEMRAVTRESDPRVVIAVPHWSPRGDLINFLSNRNSPGSDVTLWLARPDGSETHDSGIVGAGVCWSSDGRQVYFFDSEKGALRIRKVGVEGGQPVTVRTDNGMGCSVSRDGTLYYVKMLTQGTGSWDFEIRAANPESAPSKIIGWVSGTRVPSGVINLQVFVSPDGKWLATPLMDGSTTNLWALSTTGGGWRQMTDFGPRNVMISRRIDWSRDSKSLYASVSDVDSDIVRLSGLKW